MKYLAPFFLHTLQSFSKSHEHTSISVRGAVAEIALDYKKKKNVFRLTTEAKAEYLFEAPDDKEMKAWISAINAFAKVMSLHPFLEIMASGCLFSHSLRFSPKMSDDSPVSPRHGSEDSM